MLSLNYIITEMATFDKYEKLRR